tara:strand:+ start:1616 stop:2350 length:735 start_codon:yes stop_codon:yes gene_type:complete
MFNIQAKMVVNFNSSNSHSDETFNNYIRHFYVKTVREKMNEQNPNMKIGIVNIQVDDKLSLYIFNDIFNLQKDMKDSLFGIIDNIQDNFYRNQEFVKSRKDSGKKELMEQTDYKIGLCCMEIIYAFQNHSKKSYDKGLKKLIELNSTFIEEYEESKEEGKEEEIYIHKQGKLFNYVNDKEFTFMEICETMQKNVNNFNKLEEKSNRLFDWWNVKTMDMNDDFDKCYSGCILGYSEFCKLELNKK